MPKVALKGDEHICPAYCGSKAHKGGEILEGSELVKINGIPVALVGHKCECSCATDTIVTGSSTFTINGIPVAIQGSKTAHGGEVLKGESGLSVEN